MIEPNPQFDDLDRQISDRLRQDLRGLCEPPGVVPARADKTILDQARRQLAKPRRVIIRLRWAAGVAAAAAVIALGLVLLNPQSEIRNPQSLRPALADGRADIDGNGRVDILDAFRLARSIEARGPADPQWDLNGDGLVDKDDVDLVASAAVRLEPRLQARRGETLSFVPVRVAASRPKALGMASVDVGNHPQAALEAATRFDASGSGIQGTWGVVDLLRGPLGKGV